MQLIKRVKMLQEASVLKLHGYIDRARLAEKSARKDEKTLFWPPPIAYRSFGYQINGKQNSAEINNNQIIDDIRIVKQQV